MRIGVNPEKLKKEKHKRYKHRVIVPVYIPNIDEVYYRNLFLVFKKCIKSLLQTTNKNDTAITIINNNSKSEIKEFIQDLLESKSIDKVVNYTENQGKVAAILAELKSSYEPLLTISDADVFFMNDWEQNVLKIFNSFPRAGWVSPLPCPAHYSYLNNSGLSNHFFNLKKGNILKNEDFDLFESGVNPKENFFNGKKHSWKEKQYYVEKNNIKAILGASHFVATLRRDLVDVIPNVKPEYIFVNGDECKYIERYIDFQGYGRYSTSQTNVYHMGNTIEQWVENYNFEAKNEIIKLKLSNKKSTNSIYFFFNRVKSYFIRKRFNN